jgi:two-component system sensor histidine kinase ChvG
VSLSRAGKYVRLTVADTGPGVPEADQERIFERYFSSREGTASRGANDHHMGIGLWIVRRNVEAVGGRVETQNRPQGGFSISIELPVVG